MALDDYIIVKPIIETENLRLRSLNVKDIPSLNEWMPDKSMYTYWGKGPGVTDKQPRLLFVKEEKQTKSFHLGMEEKCTGKIIGELWIYLIENNRMANVAIRVATFAQGKGYGTESLMAITDFCFSKTELQRLQAEIDVRNLPSIRLFEKCGFQREGMIRQGKMVNTWCDYYIYSKLFSD